MLISKAPDEDEDTAEECVSAVEDDSHEYQTANDLFEFMAKNQNFNINEGGTLTQRDLVLLYKNIDLSTKLISNRRVETIVCSEDPESDSSDISEIYSNEDLQNVILINKEQIDFLNSHSSVENKLCHKLGDFEIQTSVEGEYDKHFLFKDPYIKEQLKNFNLFSNGNDVEASVLPASLLDYVCCKRLEDNYNFYMDNIIRYVKNTIDQLKRISNGDYLTDKAKEKWREVDQAEDTSCNNTKVLATSTSIPLHVECKFGGLKSTWDDLVHSAVDVRSLSKILEKKIIVEIPKLLNGSFTLLSKYCADNLIISCKQDCQRVEDSKKSRVDVLLQLKRSETGHVVSNISSIMILQSTPAIQDPNKAVAPLPLPCICKEIDEVPNDFQENDVKVIELDAPNSKDEDGIQENSTADADDEQYEDDSDSFGYRRLEHYNTSFNSSSQDDIMTESSGTFSSNLDMSKRHTQKEASFDVCPDDLRVTIQRLATQTALPEESVEDVSQSTTMKRKSPTRIRIKSPYENQSHILEEKKRKKLLEIRERRERKKMALAESCKITKHKYGKGAVMPQASSSVTKLSITNKSFYNSIYGHIDTKVDIKQTNNRNRQKDVTKEAVQDSSLNLTSSQEKISAGDSQKFINRSYYLDDTVTEMMYMKMKKQEKDVNSGSNSAVSSDYRSAFNFPHLISPFDYDQNEHEEKIPTPATPQHLLIGPSDSEGIQENNTKGLTASQSILNIAPANTPKALTKTAHDKNDLKRIIPSVECRKSIDKIYQLVKKLGKNQNSRSKPQSIFSTNTSTAVNAPGRRGTFYLQGSDSGTSLKPLSSPSNPSSFTFNKNSCNDASNIDEKKPGSPTTVTKVVISTKSQIPVPKTDKTKDRKRSGISPTNKGTDSNPLKAISQLLHEFENVQRKRLKSGEQKSVKKSDGSNDGKTASTYKKRLRFEQHSDYVDRYTGRPSTSKDSRSRQAAGVEGLKIPYQQVPVDDKIIDRNGKKKIMDILDEAKEARGEAVKGPSKFTSRLNSLAQPKRTYVQAHSEEYQTRYGRNLITDRLQRLASAPSPTIPDRSTRVAHTRNNKIKRSRNEVDYTVSMKQPVQTGFPIERPAKSRSSCNNSPVPERGSIGGSTYIHVPIEKPEALKKKMVAVESYVKNHYGHNLHESRIPQKSRAPVLPSDIDIALTPSLTLLESTEIGSNLHRMIESMMTTTSHGLDVLTECLETNSSKDHTDDTFNYTKLDEGNSVDSDYTSGTTDDGLLMTSNYNKNEIDKNTEELANIEQTSNKNDDLQPVKSLMTLEKRALCSHLSLGTFSKHLKINNSTETSKSSIQRLLLLQSGDAGSVVVKASVSQNDKLLKLKRMPVLSKTHWNLRFPNIPMHITTVGYAFPEYKSIPPIPNEPNQLKGITNNAHKATLVCHHGAHNTLSVNETYADNRHKNKKQHHTHVKQTVNVDVLNPPATSKCKKTQETAYNDVSKSVSIQATTDDEEAKSNRNETKVTQTAEENCTSDASKTPDPVECTTSLDILVGLLNEIQKITTCQTHITNNENDDCKELEMLLNKAAALEQSIGSTPYNNVSITSLDKLRCLDSNPSLYSFYISDTEDKYERTNMMPNIDPWYETKNSAFHTTICVDKEVNVDIADRECVNTLTDVPSVFLPITISHSTNMTNTLVEEFCQSSLQSISKLTFNDYHTTYSNTLSVRPTHSDDLSKKIVEVLPLPQDRRINKTNQQNIAKVEQKTNETNKFHKVKEERKVHKRQTGSLVKGGAIKSNVIVPKNNCCLKSADFDPVMKLKRDILVTVYSMLVLTVFAALSFPEVLYHVM